MLFITGEQFAALGRQGDWTLYVALTREISLIRAHVAGVDHTTPAENLITTARHFGERHGLTAVSDLQNLVITSVFRNHAQFAQRYVWLMNTLSSRQASVRPLSAHILAVHARNIERDHGWRTECA